MSSFSSLRPLILFSISLFASLLFNLTIHFHDQLNWRQPAQANIKLEVKTRAWPYQGPPPPTSKPQPYSPLSTTATKEPNTTKHEEGLQDCLMHFKPVVNATKHHVRDGSAAILEQPLPRNCGSLRRTRFWASSADESTFSLLEQEIRVHQKNCSAPVMRFDMDNDFGLGSHLVLWSQALCNAWEKGYRVRTFNPSWLWLDRSQCQSFITTNNSNDTTGTKSPLHCYFPDAESHCPDHEELSHRHLLELPPVPDPKNRKAFCTRLKHADNTTLREFRSASFAYLFRQISPLVIREAERQLGLLFPETGGKAPDGMIAVHIRWGDKFWEMDLAAIEEYVQAVHHILQQQKPRPNESINNHQQPVHIYLATEDPRAAVAFQMAIANETNWRVYLDRTVVELNEFRPTKGNRASWATRNTQGRAGLVALGSLFVALEAQDFVVTTQSNWSRLLVALSQHLGPGNNATIVDLRPGDW